MNKTNVSQRLSAQMQFKSLLLLTLLAGTAPAQQTPMPPLNLEYPGIPTLNAPSVDEQCDSSRSTWTLRQHATWLLGLKPRQVVASVAQPAPPAMEVELQPTVAELPQLPDMSRDAVMLVQHTEPISHTAPIASSEQPTLVAQDSEAAVVTAAGETTGAAQPVAHALQSSPHSLNLRPVLSGPAPALPLEAMAAESLLQVDVSGVDPSKLGAMPSQPESLIDSFGFRPPTGFSMSDSEPASLVASPSHAKPVSIHEGFAPRNSSANQSAQLSTTNGPIHNRLSDKDGVEESEADRTEKVYQKLEAKKTARAVEKSFSDKDLLLASLPVEVSGESDKTSRSSRIEVLTPPSRLSKEAAKALPLSGTMQIASTGVEDSIPNRQSLNEGSKPAEAKPELAATMPSTVTQAGSDKVSDKPVESLIDGMVPPTLLTAEVTNAPAPVLSMSMSDKPAIEKPVIDKPVTASNATVVKKESSKPAEKFALSDANPIALTRPVVKAANVAIPDSAGPESSVVQSSHEMDEGGRQLAEYAKMAAKMQQAIKQKFPNCRVKITCNEDGLIANGHVANNAEASKLLSYVRKTSLCPVADRITTSQ